MEESCEACGGELMEGKIAGMHAAQFYPVGEFEKLNLSNGSSFGGVVFRILDCKTIQETIQMIDNVN